MIAKAVNSNSSGTVQSGSCEIDGVAGNTSPLKLYDLLTRPD